VGQGHDRVEGEHPPAEEVERDLRPGDVGHDEVEEALARLQPRSLGHDRRRCEVGQRGQGLSADRLAGLLDPAHRLAHLGQHGLGLLDAHRQRRPHGRHPVAQRAALGVDAH